MKRKVSIACESCYKSHMPCDNNRPCERCEKKGSGHQCVDHVRKLPKYITNESSELNPTKEKIKKSVNAAPSKKGNQGHEAVSIESGENDNRPSIEINTSSEPLKGKTPAVFGSEAMNLEYALLSEIVMSQSNGLLPDTSSTSLSENIPSQSSFPHSNNHSYLNAQNRYLDKNITNGSISNYADSNLISSTGSTEDILENTDDLIDSFAVTTNYVNAQQRTYQKSAKHIYDSVKKPYDYREGFHYLVTFVKDRMEKRDIMRICKALAQFRPSFMALIMNLCEDDLIFMEKCFQRTLLEYDKLVAVSGTPTVVWRRTGEVALISKEFTFLTGWSTDNITPSKKSYIYEWMNNESAVEYWEKFSEIAFDNARQSIMTRCTLKSVEGHYLDFSFCFTIKRDIFDIPLVIVGNFLPKF